MVVLWLGEDVALWLGAEVALWLGEAVAKWWWRCASFNDFIVPDTLDN